MKQRFRLVQEVFTEYWQGVIYPFAAIISVFYHPKVHRNKNAVKGVIILVFCWFTPNIEHNKWVNFLEMKGFRTYLVHVPLLFEDFEKSAKRLNNFLQEHKFENYTLVGISTGAVVCLYFINLYKKWDNLNRFISLGGPLRGTLSAYLLYFCKKGRDMLPGSNFMRKLQNMSFPTNKIITISAGYDEFVSRYSNNLPGAQTYSTTGWGHNSLHLNDGETYKLIVKIINKKSLR